MRTWIAIFGCVALGVAATVTGWAPSAAPRATPQFVPAAMRPDGFAASQTDPASLPAAIDLSNGLDAAFSVAEPEIIDTRDFSPQIQADEAWTGDVRRVKTILPEHTRRPAPPLGEVNELPVGELLAEPRTAPQTRFPTISQTPWTPPDPTLAVGPDHVVVTVNMAIAFYTKSGTQQFSSNLDSTGNPGFFESVGGSTFTFDPKCFYDHYSGRFVVIALEVYGSSEAWIAIAVSDDSDPNGVWYKYRTWAVVSVGSDTFWVDYPGFGYDEDAWYVTGNLFGLNNGGWAGVLFRTYRKADMLTGGTASFADLRDGGAASVQAAQHFGAPPAAYFASINSTSSLKIHAITNPLGTPTLSTTTTTVSSFTYPSSGATNPGGDLDVLGDRLMNVCWRDGKLHTTHTVRSNSKNVARWYELATNNWPTSGSVTSVQSGNVDGGSGVHTFMPAVYSNKYGDLGMVVAHTTAGTNPAVYTTGRRTTDAAGTMGALTEAKTGTTGASGRWGDYFDLAVDPLDDATFWLVGEYATSTGWATWVSSFQITDCPPPTVTQQPASVDACPGDQVVLQTASSAVIPQYQWRRGETALVDGPNLVGSQSAVLIILSAESADAGADYNCLITDLAGDCYTVTANAAITLGNPPTIDESPTSTTVTEGDSVGFHVSTTEQEVLFTFQWLKDGVPLVDGGRIGGVTATTLAISDAQPEDAGVYECVVTRADADACSTTSASATLTVEPSAGCANGQPACDDSDFYPAGGDCVVDLADLGQLLSSYQVGVGGKTRDDGDIFPAGGDGFVDLGDLGQLLSHYGTDCR